MKIRCTRSNSTKKVNHIQRLIALVATFLTSTLLHLALTLASDNCDDKPTLTSGLLEKCAVEKLFLEELPSRIANRDITIANLPHLLPTLEKQIEWQKSKPKPTSLKIFAPAPLQPQSLSSTKDLRRELLSHYQSESPALTAYFTNGTYTTPPAFQMEMSLLGKDPEWIFLLLQGRKHQIHGVGSALHYNETIRVFQKEHEALIEQVATFARERIEELLLGKGADIGFAKEVASVYRNLILTLSVHTHLISPQKISSSINNGLSRIVELLELEQVYVKMSREIKLSPIIAVPLGGNFELNCEGIPKYTGKSLKKVLLDPGHLGGTDTFDDRYSCPIPSHAACGYREGLSTFTISHVLAELLVKCSGLDPSQVLFTRKGLDDVAGQRITSHLLKSANPKQDPRIAIDSLMLRSSLVSLLKPDLFLSIHLDATTEQMATVYTPRNSRSDRTVLFTDSEAEKKSEVIAHRLASDYELFFQGPDRSCQNLIKFDFAEVSRLKSDYAVLRQLSETSPGLLFETMSFAPMDFKARANAAAKGEGPYIMVNNVRLGVLPEYECISRALTIAITNYFNDGTK